MAGASRTPTGRRGAAIIQGSPQDKSANSFRGPKLILAADHRARGVITIEPYSTYLGVLRAAMQHCDGVLASAQPLMHLSQSGAIRARQRSYLSINRTGLAGSAFELDDRLVASVARAKRDGWSGIKHMTRIDMRDPHTAGALELLGKVIEEARDLNLEAMIEVLPWSDGHVTPTTDAIVHALVIVHDMGAPIIKAPIPAVEPGAARVEAVARIVSSVGSPVLFLGGPPSPHRQVTLEEVRDVIVGGAAGMALGRAIIQDPNPSEMARLLADVVHGRAVATAPATKPVHIARAAVEAAAMAPAVPTPAPEVYEVAVAATPEPDQVAGYDTLVGAAIGFGLDDPTANPPGGPHLPNVPPPPPRAGGPLRPPSAAPPPPPTRPTTTVGIPPAPPPGYVGQTAEFGVDPALADADIAAALSGPGSLHADQE